MMRWAGVRARFGVRAGCVLAVVAGTLGWQLAGAASGVGLPDGRAYELVSAADKNGGDVIGDPERVRIADDGSAVGYGSLTEFGDSVGGGIATDYLSVRSPQAGGQGWVTHGIVPPQPALSFPAAGNAFEPRYEQDFSPDLQRGVLFAWRPVTSDPLVANVANLYWRDDLRTVGGGAYRLVTGCPLCIGPLSSSQLLSDPIMVASTPDLSRVLFESTINLAPGAVGSARKLYEWDAASGQVVLAGVLPNGSGAFDSAAGFGHGRFEHRHAISADGRKVFFMATPAGGANNVYMRLDERTTVQLNVPDAGVSSSAASARYGDATPDGARVFFTTAQQLTADAPSGGGVYMYDTTLPLGDPDHLIFIAPGSQIVGASADGHILYFTASEPLLPGQSPPPFGAAMYAWIDGRLAFVANIEAGDARLTEGFFPKTARVSPSGSLTFFSEVPSATNPVGSCPASGTRACNMLYVATPASPLARCVSCRPDGSSPSTSTDDFYIVSGGAATVTGHLARIVTDDGRRVFFTTADALLPEDVNGKRDAYEYDVPSGTLSLISSGRSSADSYFMEANPDGSDALFYTREQLVGWDTDTNYDLYDARVGGGFPEPVAAAPECSGQDCRPAPSAPLPFALPTSQAAHTSGNPSGHRRPHAKACRRGQVRKRVHGKIRCVKHKRRPRHRSAPARRTR